MTKKKSGRPPRSKGRPQHDQMMQFASFEALRRISKKPLLAIIKSTVIEDASMGEAGIEVERPPAETIRSRHYRFRARCLQRSGSGSDSFGPEIDRLIEDFVEQYKSTCEGSLFKQ